MIERLEIYGQTRRMKLNPSGRLIRIEGLLSGGQDRVDQGQEGTGRGRKKDPILPGEFLVLSLRQHQH